MQRQQLESHVHSFRGGADISGLGFKPQSPFIKRETQILRHLPQNNDGVNKSLIRYSKTRNYDKIIGSISGALID